MRSPNLLIALGVSTLVSIGAVSPSPTQAAPLDQAAGTVSNKPQSLSESGAKADSMAEGHLLQASAKMSSPIEASVIRRKAQEPNRQQPVSEQSDSTAESESATSEATPGENPAAKPDMPTEATDSSPSEATTPETPETAQTPSSEEPAATDNSGSNSDRPAASETAPASETPAPTENDGDRPAAEETPAPETPETSDTVPPTNTSTPEATPAPETAQPAESNPEPAATTPDTPEYLNPSPNPLDFPTRPEEVQLVGTQPITLRQAAELAVRNSPDLQQVREQLVQAQAQLQQAEAANNPTVTANASLAQSGSQQVTSQSPFTVSAGGQLVPNPRANDTDIQWSDSAVLGGTLEVNYALFTSGQRSSNIRSAAGQVRSQQLEVERQTNQLILDVSNAYYDLQQAGAEVEIFQANLVQAEQSLRDAEALERAGVGTRFDVLQAQVDVANAQQDLTQQLSQLDIARRQLAQLLNVSNNVNITPADPIEVAGVWDLNLEQSIVQAFKNRAELEQQLVQRDVFENQRRAALAQLGPQVNLSGSASLQNNLDAGNGFLASYQAGVGVSLNVFDGGSARAQARQSEARIAQSESQLSLLQDQIRFQVEQAYSQLQANFANIQTTALAVQQATEALRLARLRFQAGVGTQTDVLRQQAALAQTQVSNLRAILGYNRSLATLQRSISNLPEGYLSETP
ncbi:MAG TPA: TolC family protein [Trichocoleus sp.]